MCTDVFVLCYVRVKHHPNSRDIGEVGNACLYLVIGPASDEIWEMDLCLTKRNLENHHFALLRRNGEG